jgi:glycosyltransferase involved in cell wall biosynthesis
MRLAKDMRILISMSYFAPAEGFGGPVESAGMLAAAVHAAGVETVVLTTDADGLRPRCVSRPGWETLDGVRVHYSRCRGFSKPASVGRFFFSPGLATQLLRIVPSFDLLHLQGTWVFPTLSGSRAALLYGVPYILTPRGSLFPWALARKSLKKRIYLSLIERSTLCRAARLHYTSELERRVSEEAFPDIPGVVVPNPVDGCPASVISGAAFRKRIGVAEQTPLVVFLGRLHPEKGLDMLVESARRVAAEIPGVVFALIGPDEGGYGEVIRAAVARSGLERTVRLPGAVRGQEKWEALKAADIFVFPSHRENFGMAAAEALSCGVPVVTSDAVGIADDIREGGAGLVVERTVDGFARGLMSLLQDGSMRTMMGVKGRELVAARYSPEFVAEAMIKVYEDVVREHLRKPVPFHVHAARALAASRLKNG